MKAIQLEALRVDAGKRPILGPLQLDFETGAWTLVVGRSGSGKTTLLRAITGLVRLAAGRVRLFGVVASDAGKIVVPPDQRAIGMVFQGGGAGLWPHISVRATLEFVLSCRHVPRADRARRASELIDMVDLAPYAERKPGELSGGEAQRLALARALAGEPKILLLDEPLGPLDAELRATMIERVNAIHRARGLTTIQVTHDPHEVAHVADARVRLESGHVVPAEEVKS